MVTMRRSRPEDRPRERELWRMAFGDDPEYIDGYYRNTHNDEWAVVLEDASGIVQTMLIGFPTEWKTADGEVLPAVYYYALGTDPAARKKGYGRMLFRYAEETFLAEGRRVMTLLPGEPSLYGFFRTIDYTDLCFSVRKWERTAETLPETDLTAEQISPHAYNRIREMLLTGKPHLAYGDWYYARQRDICQLYGGGLLRIFGNGTESCAVAEYAPDGTLLLKELLCPEEQTEEMLSAVVRCFPAAQCAVNLPDWVRGFGRTEAYGTAHWMQPEDRRCSAPGMYLGLALD